MVNNFSKHNTSFKCYSSFLFILSHQQSFLTSLPKCEVRYGSTLAQHRHKFAEDRCPISCRCWNDNSGMHLASNSGPNSGRQNLFSAQQRANAVPNFGFLTSRMGCRGKSDTWPSSMPSMGQTLALLLSELDAIVKVTIGLVQGRYWARFRLKVGQFKQSTKAVVVGSELNRCKRRHWPNNSSRLLAANIGPILCRIITFGNSH